MNGNMKRDEELVAKWLRSEGHDVCHLTDGGDPPDLVVDGDIAVEVTTINSFAHSSIWQFLDKTFKSLGRAENGRGYWVAIEYEDESMFQAAGGHKRDKMKAELRQHIKQALCDHYRNPASVVRRRRHGVIELPVIKLPYGLTLEIMGEISDNPDRCKYKVGIGGESMGEIVEGSLIKDIQATIDKKSANKVIQERAANYREWWLVVTDRFSNVRSLAQDGWKRVSDTIVRREPWKRIIAVAVGSNEVRRVV